MLRRSARHIASGLISSLPLNSAIVPLHFIKSPDGTIVNSVPHVVVPSAVASFVAPSLPATPVLRQPFQHSVSGLISSVSDKSTCILRSLNLMRSSNGTIVLSSSAPVFIPRSVPSVLSCPKLAQNVDGTIGLASSVLPVLPVLKLIQPASRAIVDSSVPAQKSKVLLPHSRSKFVQNVDGIISLASSVPQRSLRNVVDIDGWTTVGRSESSVVFPRVITDSLPVLVSPSHLLPVPTPSKQPKRCAQKRVSFVPIAKDDSLTDSERILLDNIISANKIALIASASATVPVRKDDEFNFDEFLVRNNDISMPSLFDDADSDDDSDDDDDINNSFNEMAFTAVRMQFSDLKPESNSAGKEEYLRDALKSRDTALLTVATQFEIDKQTRIG